MFCLLTDGLHTIFCSWFTIHLYLIFPSALKFNLHVTSWRKNAKKAMLNRDWMWWIAGKQALQQSWPGHLQCLAVGKDCRISHPVYVYLRPGTEKWKQVKCNRRGMRSVEMPCKRLTKLWVCMQHSGDWTEQWMKFNCCTKSSAFIQYW